MTPIHPRRRRRRASFLLVLALGGTLLAAGCRQSALAFGGSGAQARLHADDFLGAIATRFTNVQRTGRFVYGRGRLGRYALTPSKIIGDTGVWTARGPEGRRVLTIEGALTDRQYVFAARADAGLPARVGDSRHVIGLRPMAGEADAFEWTTTVDEHVGAMPVDGLFAIFGGLLRGVEILPEAGVRAEYRTQFPRTTAALGRLFTMDTLRSAPHREGGRAVTLSMTLHPDRLRAEFPAFATYLEKYIGPARYRFTLRDRTGARWLEIGARDDRLTIRLRTAGGVLLPFEGAPRAMPDQLRLDGEFFAHVMIFDVGASRITADVTRLRTAREQGWHFRFAQEPEWHLPLASRHLIRAPLRRPFTQGGATLAITLRGDEGGPTMLARHARVVVQESAIQRWLGALAWAAMKDFSGASERDENRFIAEAFGAMREDTRRLAGRPAD